MKSLIIFGIILLSIVTVSIHKLKHEICNNSNGEYIINDYNITHPALVK